MAVKFNYKPCDLGNVETRQLRSRHEAAYPAWLTNYPRASIRKSPLFV